MPLEKRKTHRRPWMTKEFGINAPSHNTFSRKLLQESQYLGPPFAMCFFPWKIRLYPFHEPMASRIYAQYPLNRKKVYDEDRRSDTGDTGVVFMFFFLRSEGKLWSPFATFLPLCQAVLHRGHNGHKVKVVVRRFPLIWAIKLNSAVDLTSLMEAIFIVSCFFFYDWCAPLSRMMDANKTYPQSYSFPTGIPYCTNVKSSLQWKTSQINHSLVTPRGIFIRFMSCALPNAQYLPLRQFSFQTTQACIQRRFGHRPRPALSTAYGDMYILGVQIFMY